MSATQTLSFKQNKRRSVGSLELSIIRLILRAGTAEKGATFSTEITTVVFLQAECR